MRQVVTIAKRELASQFFSPIAYVVLGLFALGTSMIFLATFRPGEPATLRNTLQGVVWTLVFLVPAISMRLISDEFRSGSIEPLMTAPVTDTQVIVGKWLGALGFFASLLVPLVVLVVVLEVFADPDYGPIMTEFVGLMLIGGLYLAIGIFSSAATQNQIIAFLLTVFIISLFTVALFFLPQTSFISPGTRQAMFYLNVHMQFEDFNKGVTDTSNLVYFVSGTALFLFMAVKLLESKRWR